MNLIAVQSYVKVQSQIIDAELSRHEEERKLYLYPDRLVTKHRVFLTKEILDMSYRKIGEEGGLLYVHTIKGVFSYTVHVSPQPFIEAFRRRVKKEYF